MRTYGLLDDRIIAMLGRYPHGCVLSDDVAYEVDGVESPSMAARILGRLRRNGLVRSTRLDSSHTNWTLTSDGRQRASMGAPS